MGSSQGIEFGLNRLGVIRGKLTSRSIDWFFLSALGVENNMV